MNLSDPAARASPWLRGDGLPGPGIFPNSDKPESSGSSRTPNPAPKGGRVGVRGAIRSLPNFPLLKKFCLFFSSFPAQARAATVSAQVSTFVRIASSEYEERFTRSRLKVIM